MYNLCATTTSSGMSIMDWVSIISFILGVVSLILSIWIYFKSADLTNKTNNTLTKIDESTKKLTDLYDNYVKEIFELFKNTHNKMSDRQFGDPSVGGSKEPKEKSEK